MNSENISQSPALNEIEDYLNGAGLNSRVKEPVAWRSFFRLTGGSFLYCLSALSIIYGISQILGPQLITSKRLIEILPSFLSINIYEFSLVAVLLLIVVWKNVTDDAISLVVLIALFLAACGITLGIAASRGPVTCIYIGAICFILAVIQVAAMRRWVRLEFGPLSMLGICIILLWIFFSPVYIANLFERLPTEELLRRSKLVTKMPLLLFGAVLVFIEVSRLSNNQISYDRHSKPFLHTPAMTVIFTIILLLATMAHKYYLSDAFVVADAMGDYVPVIAVCALLTVELLRCFGRKPDYAEPIILSVPLFVLLVAIEDKSVLASFKFSFDLFLYPPVMLGLIGTAILLHALYRGNGKQLYACATYLLGVLLTVNYSPDKPYQLNWELAGGGLILILFIMGIINKNPHLCVTALIIAAVGIEMTDLAQSFARRHDIMHGAYLTGIFGLGTLVVYLIYNDKLHPALPVIGSFSSMVSLFMFLGSKAKSVDIFVVLLILAFGFVLWIRTKDIIAIIVSVFLLIYPGYKIYLLGKELANWWFVIVSFVLLVAGTAFSLFKKQLLPHDFRSEDDNA